MSGISPYGGDTSRKFEATGFFRLEKADSSWWMVDPDGYAFITIGLNHTDETNLKYEHNIDIWREKYGSRENWIKGLTKEMKEWGFNTIGWTSDYISGDWGQALDWFGDPINLGHSMPWTVSDYKKADMPYVIQLRVAEIEDWNGYPHFPDVHSEEFEAYCEYLGRSICQDYADDKNLIGYYLVDIPAWLPHASGRDFNVLQGLDERTRNIKVYDVAYKYYETVTKYIRKYDPNHLILGDRYNGNKGIPKSVLTAMKPFVDVLSVQYFPDNSEEGYQQMKDDLSEWQQLCDKPVILADIGNFCCTKMNPNRVSPLNGQAERAQDYIHSIDKVLDQPWFLGWHWCAHVENKARGWGVKDPYDQPYDEFINPVKDFNHKVYTKLK